MAPNLNVPALREAVEDLKQTLAAQREELDKVRGAHNGRVDAEFLGSLIGYLEEASVAHTAAAERVFRLVLGS